MLRIPKVIKFQVLMGLLIAGVAGATPALAEPESCLVPILPQKVTLSENNLERVVRVSDTFTIRAESLLLGKIQQKFFNLTRYFAYSEHNGRPIALAKEKVFAWGRELDVYDCRRVKIGTIREVVVKNVLTVDTVYTILDAQGKVIARSGKMGWFTTQIVLLNAKKRPVATIERPLFNLFTDQRDIVLNTEDGVDPRLLMILATYKSMVDSERRQA